MQIHLEISSPRFLHSFQLVYPFLQFLQNAVFSWGSPRSHPLQTLPFLPSCEPGTGDALGQRAWSPPCQVDVGEVGENIRAAVPMVAIATEITSVKDAFVVAVELQLVFHLFPIFPEVGEPHQLLLHLLPIHEIECRCEGRTNSECRSFVEDQLIQSHEFVWGLNRSRVTQRVMIWWVRWYRTQLRSNWPF